MLNTKLIATLAFRCFLSLFECPCKWVYAKKKKSPQNKNKSECDCNILTFLFYSKLDNTSFIVIERGRCSPWHAAVAVHRCCSAAQSCLTPCDPMDCVMPGFPVLHHLLEFFSDHHQTCPQPSVASALVQPLHSFWSC